MSRKQEVFGKTPDLRPLQENSAYWKKRQSR